MSITRSKSDQYWFKFLFTQDGSTTQALQNFVTMTSSTTGSSVPHWRVLVKAGSQASSAYTADRYFCRVTPGNAVLYGTAKNGDPGTGFRTTLSQRGVGNPARPNTTTPHLTTSLAKAEAAALKQIYNKIAQEQSHMNGLAFMGEIRQTISMLKHPFRSVVDLTQRHVNFLLKSKKGLRGNVTQQRETYARIVSSTYLEYVFGLRPLISDTRDIAESIARWQLEREGTGKPRSRAVGRGSDLVVSLAFVEDSTLSAPNSKFVFIRTFRTETERRVQYVCGLESTPRTNVQATNRLTELLGFSFENFIPAVWEVLPWSWLADYFLNIGDIIQAGVTNTSAVTWINRTEVQLTHDLDTSTVNPKLTTARLDASGFNGSGYGSLGSFETRRTTMTRTIPASLGMPPLVVSYPDTLGKLANMAAVLVQQSSSTRLPNLNRRFSNPY